MRESAFHDASGLQANGGVYTVVRGARADSTMWSAMPRTARCMGASKGFPHALPNGKPEKTIRVVLATGDS